MSVACLLRRLRVYICVCRGCECLACQHRRALPPQAGAPASAASRLPSELPALARPGQSHALSKLSRRHQQPVWLASQHDGMQPAVHGTPD